MKVVNEAMAKVAKDATLDEESRSGFHPVPSTSNPKIATEIEIRDAIGNVRDALNKRQPRQPNIWVFYSNKNNQLLTILGDLTFIQCVLFEGDPAVAHYQAGNSSSEAEAEEYFGKVEVIRHDGKKATYRCQTEEKQHRAASTKSKAAVAAGPSDSSQAPFLISERDLAKRMVEFANWLLLSGAITRARSFSTANESSLLMEAIDVSNGLSIGDAMKMPNADPALMLAAIAKGLANGVLTCDLQNELLSLNRTILLNADRAQSQAITNPPRAEPSLVTLSMARNRRTASHPELFAHPERWLVLDGPELPENDLHRRQRKAVLLYIQNRPYEEIFRETGMKGAWVRKLFQRTFEPGNDQSPLGLRALVRYRHWQPYMRHSDLPLGNLSEGRQGGYAGALMTLAARFPNELTAMIEDEVLKKRLDSLSHDRTIREARVSWTDLHGRFLQFLREKGLGDSDYPFNTRDEAYSSLVSLCNAILFKKPLRWIASRGGDDAKRRTRIGQGSSSLISPQWLNQICELDYQKQDSAAIVEIATPKKTTIDVPVRRWWAGAIVEAYSQALMVTSDSFESNTTEDCLMELIDLAVVAPAAVDRLKRFEPCPDGCWLPAQLLPEYAGHAWDILKLDRAWAHKSTTAISAIVATVGCAICFGEARAWYARHLVERTFEKLTQAGPQNLPSTFGTGPKDTRKNDPDHEALKWRFLQDDICDLIKASARWLNSTGNEGTFWAKPLDVISSAMTNSEPRFFPRPYPLPRQQDRPTMWHTIPHKVEGNALRGLAPCVRVNRTRFYSRQLARCWNLIGQNVWLQVFRRQFQISRVLSSSGELVSYVTPQRKWMNTPLSWRDHNLIQKYGRIKKRHEREPTPTHDFLAVKQAELTAAHNKPTQHKNDATTVARIKRNAKAQGPLLSQDESDEPEQNVPMNLGKH